MRSDRFQSSKKAAQKLGGKGMLLYFLPLPLLLSALFRLAGGHWGQAILLALAFSLCIASANFLRRGLAIESQVIRRKLLRRSSTIPYKCLAAGALASGTMLAAWSGAHEGVITSVLYGCAAALGFSMRYGLDSWLSGEGVALVGVTAEEVLDALEEAEGRLDAIEQAAGQLRQAELRQRLQRIVDGVRGLLEIIEENPAELKRSRKFLKVYLEGAQQVVAGYARTHRIGDSESLEDNFRRVLATIESVIEEQRHKLLSHNLDDLDVKIEVLQMQLEKEGVG